MDSATGIQNKSACIIEFYCAVSDNNGIESKYVENIRQLLMEDLKTESSISTPAKLLQLEPYKSSPNSPKLD
jgi:hypothetical protein